MAKILPWIEPSHLSNLAGGQSTGKSQSSVAFMCRSSLLQRVAETMITTVMRPKKLYVAESKGKSMPTKFAFKVCWEVLKVAPKWTVNCGYICDPKSASKTSEEEGAQKKNWDNRPIGNKAAKIVQKTMQKQESQQLTIDQSSIAAMECKVSGIQLAARTQRDDFHFQLFRMNPDSDASKKWMEMKLKEAVEEAELEHEQKK